MSPLRFGLAYLIPAVTFVGLHAGGPWVLTGFVFVFGITPILDAILGRDLRNPNVKDEARLARDPRYGLWLWLWPVGQTLLLVYGLENLAGAGRTPFEQVGLTLSIGVVTGGMGITAAHELMHRRRGFERAMAEILMTSVSYPHFVVEHLLGHHRRVATPDDPATALRGQTVYGFFLQTLVGSLRSAWRLESARVRKRAYGRLDLRDRRLRYALVLGLVYAGIAGVYGMPGVLFFVGQSVIAVALLEVINYVEHYGLRRGKVGDGRYERVRAEHSWNAAQRLSSWYLFNLPRHSDHHRAAHRPYNLLRHEPEAPQLPAGYATMTLVALFPPLWFRLMHPRLDALSRLG